MGTAIKRAIVIVLSIIVQVALYAVIYVFLTKYLVYLNIVFIIAGVLLVLFLIKDSKNYSFNLPWIVILLLSPVVGSLLYILLGRNKIRSKTLRNVRNSERESEKYLIQDEDIRKQFDHNTKLKYISDYAGYPVTTNNDIEYYPLGEDAFKVMIQELEKAKKFIFFEYFIVSEGKMWNSILKILEDKAHQGVDVRVMYDDLGCLATLPSNYSKKLESKGIKCIPFNHLHPFAGIIMNNRDHRKILVIDGKVAFSGGINIADEYINERVVYGHWKDNAMKIEGDAVWNYTVMFLTMWNAYRNEDEDYNTFKYNFEEKGIHKGFVVPYGETPFDREVTGEDIYLNIINQAEKYVYIFTPYLIIDTDMINSLCLAAKRGVDVRIVIPGVPDKKVVYTVSESYILPLVNAGVKVYKYTPGFIHAKVFVSDDHIATCGTINMDYRSLYLHFECGCYMEDCDVIPYIKKDVDETIEKSYEVTLRDCFRGKIKAMWQAVLRLVAPLM